MQQSNSISSASRPAVNRMMVLVILSAANVLVSFMIQALNVALPSINREFNATTTQLNWMVLVYVLAVAACSVPFGRVADILGLKRTIIIGMVIYTLSSLICLFAYSAAMLIAGRAVQGIGAAMVVANIPALITVIFPAEERGRALGMNITGVYLGSTTGPFLGGLLTGAFGWRSIFLINIPIGAVILIFVLWKIKGEWSASRGQKFDYPGSAVFAVALIVLIYGLSLLPTVTGAVPIVIGIFGLLIFLWWENRVASPLININLFRKNRTFIFSNLAVWANYSAVFAVAFLLSLYLQYNKGLSPGQAGLIMIAHPIVQAILSPIAGRVSDNTEPRIVASIGMALTTVALLSFVFLSDNTPVWQIVIALVILGTGFSMFLPSNTSALMNSVSPKYYGVASAIMSTMIAIGSNISMGITMVIMTLVVGRVSITPAYYPAFLTSTKIAFGFFTALMLAGVFISLSRGKVKS